MRTIDLGLKGIRKPCESCDNWLQIFKFIKTVKNNMNFAQEIEFAYFLYLNNWGKKEMYNCGQKSLLFDSVNDVIINFSLIDEADSEFIDTFKQFALEFDVKIPSVDEERLWNINKKKLFLKIYPDQFNFSPPDQMLDNFFILSKNLRKIENQGITVIADNVEKLSKDINLLCIDFIWELQNSIEKLNVSKEVRIILNYTLEIFWSLVGENIDDELVRHVEKLVNLISELVQHKLSLNPDE